ncbi:putative ribonuclease H-like domain-containing protein [Tanacetum coccineum]
MDTIFNIMKEEGGAEGGVIVQAILSCVYDMLLARCHGDIHKHVSANGQWMTFILIYVSAARLLGFFKVAYAIYDSETLHQGYPTEAAVGIGFSTYDKASIHSYVQSLIQINEYRDLRIILPVATKKFERHISTCVKVLDMTGLKISQLSQLKATKEWFLRDDRFDHIFRRSGSVKTQGSCSSDPFGKDIEQEEFNHFLREDVETGDARFNNLSPEGVTASYIDIDDCEWSYGHCKAKFCIDKTKDNTPSVAFGKAKDTVYKYEEHAKDVAGLCDMKGKAFEKVIGYHRWKVFRENQRYFGSWNRSESFESQLEIHGVGVSTKDANHKYLIPRVFESDVKGTTASSSSIQNVAFVSSKSTSSTNDGILLDSADQKGIKISGGEMQGTLDGVDWTGHAEDEQENFALMAYSNSGSDTEREYSNARTPQQNGVAKRKNRTLIEAARTMLADSILPNTFWAEAVSTACYVLNRVLVTKPQNKTSYELITGKIPIISYIRPFGCHVTILNTIDHLGKFEENSDEGFLVRLTDSHELSACTFLAENKAKQNRDSSKRSKHSIVKSSELKNRDEKPNGDTGPKTNEEPKDQKDQAFLEELERLKRQENKVNDAVEAFRKEFAQSTEDLLLQAGASRATSTNTVNTVSTPISIAGPSRIFSMGGPDLTNNDQDDSQILALEYIYKNPSDGIFTNASYDDEVQLNPRRYLKLLKMKVGLMLCRKSCCNLRFRKFRFWLNCLLERRQLGQNGFIGIRRMKEKRNHDKLFSSKEQRMISQVGSKLVLPVLVNTGRLKHSTARPKLSTDSTKIESMKLEAMMEVRRIFKCWFHYHTTNGHQFTMSNRHQELASPEQTTSELASPKQMALGKDISNPLIVDSLLKTIWLSMHHDIAMKHWLFQSKRLLLLRCYDDDKD